MIKAAFYGRYSSAQQTEQSIEGQLHVCQKYAATNDIEIIAEYIDRAKSGTSDKRPQFQKMISDSDKKLFDAVLVYKLDRFARNRYDSAIYKRRLISNGVKVISATEALTDGPEGIVLEALLEGMDEYYSAELARKMRRGKEESFRKGKFINAKTPYGYKVVDQRLAIDETTAPDVAKVFEMYAAGKRFSEISAEIVRADGTHWKEKSLSKTLSIPIYKGEYTIKGYEGIQPCPAIVSAELYGKVQERLKTAATRRRNGKTGYKFIFTGKLYCPGGHRMFGTSTNKIHHYYRCDKCKQGIRADELHERILTALGSYLTPDKIDELAQTAYREYAEISDDSDSTDALRTELTGVQQKIKNAVDAIVNGADIPELIERLNGLKKREEELKIQLLAAEEHPEQLTFEEFRTLLTEVAKSTPEEIVDMFADKIIYNAADSTAEIHLNFNGDCVQADLFKDSFVPKKGSLNKQIKFKLVV